MIMSTISVAIICLCYRMLPLLLCQKDVHLGVGVQVWDFGLQKVDTPYAQFMGVKG